MRIQPENMIIIEAQLTAREFEVLKLVATGMTSKQIGRQLGISGKTADAHKSKVLLKMHAKNMAHAVALAFTNPHLAD